MPIGKGVKLIVTNKGKNGTGFGVCETCGAAWLSDDPESEKEHPRPFLLPDYVRKREQPPKHCNGHVRKGLYLGHQFRTDILFYDSSSTPRWTSILSAPGSTMRSQPVRRLSRSGQALDFLSILVNSALAIASSLPAHGGIGTAEIYLFDTASGGAGYAYEVGRNLQAMLPPHRGTADSLPRAL